MPLSLYGVPPKDESDEWLSDYITSYYNEAAQPMRRFFDVIRKQEALLVSKNTVWGGVDRKEQAVFRTAVQAGRKALKQAMELAVKKETCVRIRRCASYLDFYDKWIQSQSCRQAAADAFASRGKAARRSVLQLMRKVDFLEKEMTGMTRRDDSRSGGSGDGVLESRLYRVRRTVRIEQDDVLKRKVCAL